jgi:hypothetical protein
MNRKSYSKEPLEPILEGNSFEKNLLQKELPLEGTSLRRNFFQ